MGDIFLSYARSDQRVAERLAPALEAAGLSVWWDRRLEGGAEYSDEIERAIARADKLVVLWSGASVKSPWVRDEAAAGRDQNKLVPLSIGGAVPPLGFRQFHTIDLDAWIARGSGADGVPAELVAALGTAGMGAAVDAAPGLPEQVVRFCRASDGVSLAWSDIGAGAPLFKLSNWLNHLEHEWHHPMWRHWFDLLGGGRRLVRYDQRGNGMSDWRIAVPTLDQLVDDARAVADAAGLEAMDLFAMSQGAMFAVAFANRYPTRVRRMVIVNGFPAGWRHGRDAAMIARWEAMLTLIRTGWGTDNEAFRQLFTSQMFPHATPQQSADWNALQAISASPDSAEKTLSALAGFNVTAMLDDVRARTLVLHSRGDRLVPFEAGRRLAGAIPGATFIALESDNHVLLADEPAWPRARDAIRAFLD